MTSELELKKAGLKATLPRIKILNLLEAAEEAHHYSAEDIYRLLLDHNEDVGIATVYRVLTQFEQAGIVRRLNFDDGQSKFELETGDGHDHMVCLHTGYVQEFVDPMIEQRIRAIAAEKGYEVSHHSLVVYGIYQGDRETESHA